MPKRQKKVRPAIGILTTTVAGRRDAGRLARNLVEQHRAACVQIVPVRSVYRWKGKIESSAEYLLIVKTGAERLDDLMQQVRSMHPYELPELVTVVVRSGLPDYLEWVCRESGGAM